MNFEVESFVGVGPIKLCMSRKDVQKIMAGNDVEDFKRSSSSELPSDYYCDVGVFVYYDNSECVAALEFHEPAHLLFHGNEILKMPAEMAYRLISGLDTEVEIDGDGVTSFNLGVGFYAPNYEENPKAPIESMMVFRKDYYNNQD